jgi:hypothetical protein
VKTVLRGSCTQVNKLDQNGAMVAETVSCTASSACRCDGSTTLTYRDVAVLPGTGASGRESGSLVASGPAGSVTLLFKGTRTSLGQGTGTWTIGRVTGLTGVKLVAHGAYSTQTNTLHAVTGTMNTVVSIDAAYGCWSCAA